MSEEVKIIGIELNQSSWDKVSPLGESLPLNLMPSGASFSFNDNGDLQVSYTFHGGISSRPEVVVSADDLSSPPLVFEFKFDGRTQVEAYIDAELLQILSNNSSRVELSDYLNQLVDPSLAHRIAEKSNPGFQPLIITRELLEQLAEEDVGLSDYLHTYISASKDPELGCPTHQFITDQIRDELRDVDEVSTNLDVPSVVIQERLTRGF